MDISRKASIDKSKWYRHVFQQFKIYENVKKYHATYERLVLRSSYVFKTRWQINASVTKLLFVYINFKEFVEPNCLKKIYRFFLNYLIFGVKKALIYNTLRGSFTCKTFFLHREKGLCKSNLSSAWLQLYRQDVGKQTERRTESLNNKIWLVILSYRPKTV